MSLKHCIIHAIRREGETAPVTVQLRDDNNQPGDGVLSLYEQARQGERKSSSRQVGQFDGERSDNPFPKLLTDLNEEKTSLARVSQQLMEHLKAALDSFHQPFDAHVLFAIENVMNQNIMSIYWMEHQQASHITHELDVQWVDYIDPRQVKAAISIHLSDYEPHTDICYLSFFVARGEKDLADCIKDFCCFTTEINTAAETEAFLSIVDQYTDALPDETGLEVKTDIIDYCINQNMMGEPVHVDVLSNLINEREPEQFSSFVREHQEQAKPAIHTHRPSLKRYGRITARDKDLSLSFSSSLIGEGIEFDAANGTLTIRHLPKGLKEQISKSLSKTN